MSGKEKPAKQPKGINKKTKENKMGQYYKPVLIQYGKVKVYDRSVEPDKDYVLAKLMEHSWWMNPTANAVAKMIFEKRSLKAISPITVESRIAPTFKVGKKIALSSFPAR